MASIVTPPQRARQSATELVMEMMSLADQAALDALTLRQKIWTLGRQANLAIEHTDPPPPANVIRFPVLRDAA